MHKKPLQGHIHYINEEKPLEEDDCPGLPCYCCCSAQQCPVFAPSNDVCVIEQNEGWILKSNVWEDLVCWEALTRLRKSSSVVLNWNGRIFITVRYRAIFWEMYIFQAFYKRLRAGFITSLTFVWQRLLSNLIYKYIKWQSNKPYNKESFQIAFTGAVLSTE